MQRCSFCSIAAEKSPATILWQSSENLAFFPLHPATLGHTLVVPKTHYDNLFEIPDEALGSLMQAVSTVGRALRAILHPEGINIINSTGRAASQSVFHVHIHVVPRWIDDKFGDIWPSEEHQPEKVDLEVTKTLQAYLNP